MVSRFRYFSFKAWPKSDRVPFIWIPAVVLVIVATGLTVAMNQIAPGKYQKKHRHGGEADRAFDHHVRRADPC